VRVSDTRTAVSLIGGSWLSAEGAELIEAVDPTHPDRVVGHAAAAVASDVGQAVDAAHDAFEDWSSLAIHERAAFLLRAADILEEHADALGELIVEEIGKPWREARPEVTRTAAILRHAAARAWREHGQVFHQGNGPGRIVVERRPRGVQALVTPWNFPLAIPAWKAAPALVYGNTIVLKPSELSSLTTTALVEALDASGIPPGVVNSVLGTGATVGHELVTSPALAGVSFTGSAATGELIRTAATPLATPVQLELGGQSPLIVLADADLEKAVEATYAGAFWSAGQKCASTRRVLVQHEVYSTFRDLLRARIAAGVVGDPRSPATEVGPLVSERQWQGVLRRIDGAVGDGCRRLTEPAAFDSGYFVSPTVFEDVPLQHPLSTEETFGPVVSLYPVSDLDHALDLANDTRYGLAAGIFTQSTRSADRFVRGARAGVLHVNSATAGAEMHVPFGGIKSSGWGPHEQGEVAMEFFTDIVTVYEDA